MRRRRVAEHAQPAEWIHPFEHLQRFGRDRLSCHPVETVAAGDVVAVQTIRFALMLEAQPGSLGFQVMGLHLTCLVQRGGADGGAGSHEVAGDFGLAVDHHRLAAGEVLEVDMGQSAIECEFEAIMHQAFGVHALAHAGLAQQVDHALFQHPGTDAALHVIGALALKNQGLDTGVVQQLAEQQPRRTGANDGDLGFQRLHCFYRLQVPPRTDRVKALSLIVLLTFFT